MRSALLACEDPVASRGSTKTVIVGFRRCCCSVPLLRTRVWTAQALRVISQRRQRLLVVAFACISTLLSVDWDCLQMQCLPN